MIFRKPQVERQELIAALQDVLLRLQDEATKVEASPEREDAPANGNGRKRGKDWPDLGREPVV